MVRKINCQTKMKKKVIYTVRGKKTRKPRRGNVSGGVR